MKIIFCMIRILITTICLWFLIFIKLLNFK